MVAVFDNAARSPCPSPLSQWRSAYDHPLRPHPCGTGNKSRRECAPRGWGLVKSLSLSGAGPWAPSSAKFELNTNAHSPHICYAPRTSAKMKNPPPRPQRRVSFVRRHPPYRVVRVRDAFPNPVRLVSGGLIPSRCARSAWILLHDVAHRGLGEIAMVLCKEACCMAASCSSVMVLLPIDQ